MSPYFFHITKDLIEKIIDNDYFKILIELDTDLRSTYTYI